MTAVRLTVGRAAGQVATARAVVRFVWEHPSNAGHRSRALLRLAGCTRALSERRIGLIQLEWNAMSQRVLGTDRRPVADLLALHGYQLFRPDPQGCLVPVTDPGFGADVFARPAVEQAGMYAAFLAAGRATAS
jgi:hypothetical protein